MDPQAGNCELDGWGGAQRAFSDRAGGSLRSTPAIHNFKADSSLPDTLALMAAMRLELRPLLSRLGLERRGPWYLGQLGQIRLVAAVSGVGGDRAVETFHRLADAYSLKKMIHLGFAGGLQLGVRIGQLMEFGWVIDGQGSTIRIGEGVPRIVDMQDQPSQHMTLLTCDDIVHSVAQKRQLFERHGAAAVDMESFHVATAATERRIPLQVLRVISDDANTVVPAIFSEWSSGDAPLAMAVARYLAWHPQQVPMLWRWWRRTHRGDQVLIDAIETRLADECKVIRARHASPDTTERCFDRPVVDQ